MQTRLNQSHRLRTSAAAAYCGLKTPTFEKYRMTGEGPIYISLGRAVVYDTADLDDWMASNKRRSTSDVRSNVA